MRKYRESAENKRLRKIFNEGYSPDLLDELVNDYRYEYSAETHNEIWNKILETYNDEDLANDVLAALEDGDENYEEDDDYLTESEDDWDDEDDKYRHIEWDDINEVYNSKLEAACDDYAGDPADVDGDSMYNDFMTYVDNWNKMSNEEKDQYENVEEYLRDNINCEDYIPEVHDYSDGDDDDWDDEDDD